MKRVIEEDDGRTGEVDVDVVADHYRSYCILVRIGINL